MHYISKNLWFPSVNEATPEGLLAVGGDLSVNRLVLAYKSGIFPWFDAEEPILWWSPDPRFVLFPNKLKVSKSMKQVLRSNRFKVTTNTAFKQVVQECSKIKRIGQQGTWITNSMIDAYVNLHKVGLAISVEVWQNKQLVGGLYGVDLKNGVFCGESMFAKVSNASKVGFITFIQNSNYKLIDCQVHTDHLQSLGAEDIARDLFLQYLDV
ncbi:leucyl/phenylalanyl-tRNA--protein transferase [Seonamhaeicola algicola]|uniref:Leucyl/phenylalanyl-tRNA--protein transferase n=2 Tax=Seonamhaeicola TaxID=1649495 RepID=A0A5C7AMH0_9FLAO|nr:leucyl/phenylalanyl-tRNA--protein transferase [Seonamhaeicola algicola]TXE09597.1 leucyl/phenylalanyl-tRNA--protein transferase [Seonamhaeicola algicola]